MQQAATWTLSTAAKSTGEAFAAWLALPPPSRVGVHFVVDLQPTQSMELWVPKGQVGCGANNGETHIDSAPPEGVVRVCGVGKEAQSARLVATFREVGANTGSGPLRVVGSEAITIMRRWSFDLPAWLIALITSLSGFLSGMWLQRYQRRAERRTKSEDDNQKTDEDRRAHRQAIEERLVDVLGPELVANQQLLGSVVNGGRIETLSVLAGLMFTDKQKGAFSYLDPAATPSLDRLSALYKGINIYNIACNEFLQNASLTDVSPEDKDALALRARKIAQLLASAFPPSLDKAPNMVDEVAKLVGAR